MNASPWFALLLLIAFYFCLCIEFLMPTAGMAGVAAAVALIAALAIAFTHSVAWGLGLTLFVLFTTPPLMIGLLRLWPHTPIGRRILNRRPGDSPYEPPRATTRRGREFMSLVGLRGIAKSDLLPSGLVVIDGERIDAVSSGAVINRGDSVIVVGVENRHLQVRLATRADPVTSDQDGPATPESPPTSPAALEVSLDDLDPEG